MSENDHLAFFSMVLLALCLFLAVLCAMAQGDRSQLLTQLRQCEASHE